MLSDKEMADFKAWLICCGAIVDPPTNEWEIVRARTCFGTLVAYTNGKGKESWPQDLIKIRERFEASKAMRLSPTLKARVQLRHLIGVLAGRDGLECFFCGLAWEDDDSDDITIEHFAPKSHGGPDHPSNLVLACRLCNTEAGNRSVAEKVLIRERKRRLVCQEMEAADAAA